MREPWERPHVSFYISHGGGKGVHRQDSVMDESWQTWEPGWRLAPDR
jgi:hypothetical protein